MDENGSGSDGEVMNHEIVVVGGGISGLATALALHRKGIKSVVLERAEGLRTTTGTAIGIRPNGWRALDQLGVASTLRQTALPILWERELWVDKDKQRQKPMDGEARCLMRSELINALANALPAGTIHFGQEIVSVSLHPQTKHPILNLLHGTSIVAKVVIGCDGGKSVIADFLELKSTKVFSVSAIRGLTNYPNGHSFDQEFLRVKKGNILVGRIPITAKLVYWFATHYATPNDTKISLDPELIRESTLESTNGFPQEIQEMISSSDLDSLSFTHLRYRAPWHLLTGSFHKGTVTVAGDAMHVMGPFLGQGGSAGLEDAVVLARSLAQCKFSTNGAANLVETGSRHSEEEALDQYVKQRRMRVVLLSTQTYLTGLLVEPNSALIKLACILFMVILFHNPNGHTKYDCGRL